MIKQTEDRGDIVAALERILSENRFTEFRFAESYAGMKRPVHAAVFSCSRFTFNMRGTCELDIGSGRTITRQKFEPGSTLIMKPFCLTDAVALYDHEAAGLVCHSQYLRIFHSVLTSDDSGYVSYYHMRDTLRRCTSHAIDMFCELHAGPEAEKLGPDMLRIVFSLLLEDIRNARNDENGKACNLWRRIVERIAESPDAERNRSCLAEEFHVSETYISRLFSRFAGMTFKEYLHAECLKKAVRLLRDTDLTINEISWNCGFESVSYFIRVFRVAYGMSPGRYRRLKK